jgi:hypothetical protein
MLPLALIAQARVTAAPGKSIVVKPLSSSPSSPFRKNSSLAAMLSEHGITI